MRGIATMGGLLCCAECDGRYRFQTAWNKVALAWALARAPGFGYLIGRLKRCRVVVKAVPTQNLARDSRTRRGQCGPQAGRVATIKAQHARG